MPRIVVATILGVLTLTAISGASLAQSSDTSSLENQFWPEVDLYMKLSDHSRLYGIATYTLSEDDESNDEQYGLNVDVFLQSPILDKVRGALALVENRNQRLQLRMGYRYQRSLDSPTVTVQNRLLSELTLRVTTKAFSLSDRNGVDARWTNGVYSSRYRNRLYLEVPVVLDKYDFTPYADAEWFYVITDDEWTSVRYEVGVQLPVVTHFSVEFYAGLQQYWHSTKPTARGPGINLVYSW